MQTFNFLEKFLKNYEKNQYFRYLNKNIESIDFASNDYLGLARSSLLKEKLFINNDLNQKLNGLGSTGSRLVSGHTELVEQIENQLAYDHGFEAALLYSCGYMANIGLLSSLKQCNPIIIYDESVHASMHDGIVLSRAQAFPFKHQNVNHLFKRLEKLPKQSTPFVCIESLYSIDGSIAPLKNIQAICKHFSAHLIVDEAHAGGVIGISGNGFLTKDLSTVFAKVLTFGKAYGTYGAAILCSTQLKKYLINFSRPFIYTTALPRQNLLAIQTVCQLLPKMNLERQILKQNVQLFKQNFQTTSLTQIQPLYLNEFNHPQQLIKNLKAKDFAVKAMYFPTVSKPKSCLRICLHAFNTKEDILSLTHELKKFKKD